MEFQFLRIEYRYPILKGFVWKEINVIFESNQWTDILFFLAFSDNHLHESESNM